MLVICLNCRRVVACCDEKGTVIDNCYHCRSRACSVQIRKGVSIKTEVVLTRFTNCLEHDSRHIGFVQNGNNEEN